MWQLPLFLLDFQHSFHLVSAFSFMLFFPQAVTWLMPFILLPQINFLWPKGNKYSLLTCGSFCFVPCLLLVKADIGDLFLDPFPGKRKNNCRLSLELTTDFSLLTKPSTCSCWLLHRPHFLFSL